MCNIPRCESRTKLVSSRMMSQSTKETKMKGVVAHQGERHVRNVEVVGSSPIDSTIFFIRNTLYPRIQSSNECSCSL